MGHTKCVQNVILVSQNAQFGSKWGFFFYHLGRPRPYIIFPAISWSSPRSSSFWLDHECFSLGTSWWILLMYDHHLILFLFAVCSDRCMFTRRLISSFLILSILLFPAAFLRHLISVAAFLCWWLSSFHSGKVELGEYRIYDLCLGGHADFFVPK